MLVDSQSLIRAFGSDAAGCIKQQVEDFQVTEQLGFELNGAGKHQWLYIQKVDLNTLAVAQHLAKSCQQKLADVGYSGLKDKRAITRQWFSLPASLSDSDIAALETEQIEVVCTTQHTAKLKRGTHKDNSFEIILRGVQGKAANIESLLEQIKLRGVPNYFGSQRFGHNGNNLTGALRMFEDKNRPDKMARGLFLSAARSYLFNLMLQQRVKEDSWNRPTQGDVMILDGSNSFFVPEQIDEAICQRIDAMDIHPSAALWGKGRLASADKIAEIEQGVANAHLQFAEGLCAFGLKQARRALRLVPSKLAWQWLDSDVLKLRFTLRKGTFATSLLREVVKIES